MPELLRALLALDYDYDDGEGMDFEPFDGFLPANETRDWFQAWTGNQDVDGSEFLVFGQDGTGGYAALWNMREGALLLEQPIVFLGSEGQMGVVANGFNDYLWLLAGGLGPCEAIQYPSDKPENAQFLAFALAHAPEARKTPLEVLAKAQAAFPDFEERIQALCR